MSTSPEHVKDLFCKRVDYYRGPESARAVKYTSRPLDKGGRDIWDRICEAVNRNKVNLETFIDWCFKESLPGIPYLNAVPTSMMDTFIACTNKEKVREGVDLHLQLMAQKLDTLVYREGYSIEDVLFDNRFEFHCVFACILGKKLGIDIPEKAQKNSTYLEEVFPHYHRAMEEKFKGNRSD